MDVEKTIRNLKAFGAEVSHFATGAEAAAYVASQIHHTTVGIGGCKTVEQTGLYDLLCADNDVTWHWKDGCSPEVFQRAYDAEVYICSANAVAETGEMVFIDGRGNRVSALSGRMGKTAYIIAGVKKICPDLPSAIARARSVAPARAVSVMKQGLVSRTIDTPCVGLGRCVDCKAPGRICRAILTLCGPVQDQKKLEVVLVDEDLGL